MRKLKTKGVIMGDKMQGFIEDMNRVADKLKKPVDEVSRDQFLKNTDWTRHQLDKVGHFTDLRNMFFPKPHDMKVKHGARLINSYRNKIAKQHGEHAFIQEEFVKSLDEVLAKYPLTFHKPVPKKKKSKSKKKDRVLVAHISDTHFGAKIDKDEVQINEFNWSIAARRMALFADQIVNYKPQYRKDTKLHLVVNGDIIAGVIHNQEWFADLMSYQFAGALSILGQFISYCAQHFDEVEVTCTTGNHERFMHKSDKKRATTHKFDSFGTHIYVALKGKMEKHHNVKINIPKAPYAVIQELGHTVFATHGDTVLNVGLPGNSLNMASINNQINKLNASELIAEKFDVIMVGHVHTPTLQLLENGCMLVVNGCLSGVDPYAQSIGITTSNPTQQIFEMTVDHAVGDIRLIQVKDADQQKDLDKIIKPYDYKF